MANGKARWAYQTCQMGRREDAFKGTLFVALRSHDKTKPEFFLLILARPETKRLGAPQMFGLDS